MPHPTIEVRFEQAGLRRGRNALRTFTRDLLAGAVVDLGFPSATVSVLYCSEEQIRRLNREYRNLDKATDVLSFPSEENIDELRKMHEPHLGDLAICLPYSARAAADEGRSVEDNVALLLVHGLLHLLGRDHDTKRRETAMWREQDGLLEALAALPRPRLELSPEANSA